MKRIHLIKIFKPLENAYRCYCGKLVSVYNRHNLTNNSEEATCGNCTATHERQIKRDEK